MDPVTSPHFDKTNPHQDAGTQRVQSTEDNESGFVGSVELLKNTNTNAHAKGSDAGKSTSHKQFRQAGDAGQGGNPRAKSKTFKHLVEDDDNQKPPEARVARYDGCDSDHYISSS